MTELDPAAFSFELTTASFDAVVDAAEILERNGAQITAHGGQRHRRLYAIQTEPMEVSRMRRLAQVLLADGRVSGVMIMAPISADQNAYERFGEAHETMFHEVEAALTGSTLTVH